MSLNNRNQNKNKNKKNSIKVKTVNGEVIVRVTRDNMPFFIDEIIARKKIYYAPQFWRSITTEAIIVKHESLGFGYNLKAPAKL